MDLGPQWVDLTCHCGQRSPGFEMRSHARRLGVGKWLWVLPFANEAFGTVVLNLPNTAILSTFSHAVVTPTIK